MYTTTLEIKIQPGFVMRLKDIQAVTEKATQSFLKYKKNTFDSVECLVGSTVFQGNIAELSATLSPVEIIDFYKVTIQDVVITQNDIFISIYINPKGSFLQVITSAPDKNTSERIRRVVFDTEATKI